MDFFKRFFRPPVQDGQKLLDLNKDVVRKYNYNTLKSFTLIYSIILFCLLIVSLFSNLYTRSIYRILFCAYLFNFSVIYLLCRFKENLIINNSKPFVYIFVFVLYTFDIIFNLLSLHDSPYTMFLCYLVIVPVIFIERRRNITIVNLFSWIFALALSFVFKTKYFFLIDLMNTTIAFVIGTIIGNTTRNSQLRYMDMKSHKMDKDLEVMKAKNEAKSTFLANMSHEIRTPINAMLGLNEMILRESTEKNVLHYAEDVKVSGKTLLSLVNDILDFSKIEANRMDIINGVYGLDAMINDLMNMLTPRARAKNLELNLIVDPTIPNSLYGDEIRIKQCIMNMLTNGIKYTNEGSVTFKVGWDSISEKSILLKIEVSDTGIGIKQEDIPKLFTAFRRIDEPQHRTVEGTGLGMSIVMGLLEKMGSTLYVKSEYGKGSRFWFNLQQEITSPIPIGNFQARIATLNEPQSKYKESFHAPNAHILVIDDMKINLNVIQGLLKKTQMKIDCVLSGEEALEKVKKNVYDVIFIDHRMPVMDGIETLHAMQKLPHNVSWNAPCIALTANAIAGAKELYLQEGFVDYLSKPVDYAKLEALLVSYIDKSKIQRVEETQSQEAEKQEETSSTQEYSLVDKASVADRIFFANCCKTAGMDARAAIANCGDVDVLKTAIAEYYRTIEEKSNLIEQYKNNHDWKNYTIQVHALKSSSRLIGATELSRLAAFLEQCGDKKLVTEIENKTPSLLKLYRSYKLNLKLVADMAGDADLEYQEKEKQEVNSASQKEIPPEPIEPTMEFDEETYKGVIEALKEFVQSGDFGSIKNVIGELKNYKIPESRKNFFAEIKEAANRESLDSLSNILIDE